MLTRNFKILMTRFLMTNWYSDNPNITNIINFNGDVGKITTRSVSGIAGGFNKTCNDNQIFIPPSNTTYDGMIVAVGKGTGDVSENDINLADLVPHTDMVMSSSTVGVTANYTKQYTYVLQNATNSPITITEIGLYLRSSSSNMDISKLCCLVGRELLETPVVIQSGQTSTFTYEIAFNE